MIISRKRALTCRNAKGVDYELPFGATTGGSTMRSQIGSLGLVVRVGFPLVAGAAVMRIMPLAVVCLSGPCWARCFAVCGLSHPAKVRKGLAVKLTRG
jgi:hypothetical protein